MIINFRLVCTHLMDFIFFIFPCESFISQVRIYFLSVSKEGKKYCKRKEKNHLQMAPVSRNYSLHDSCDSEGKPGKQCAAKMLLIGLSFVSFKGNQKNTGIIQLTCHHCKSQLHFFSYQSRSDKGICQVAYRNRCVMPASLCFLVTYRQ